MSLTRTQCVNRRDDWIGTHIQFVVDEQPANRKTKSWLVVARDDQWTPLGDVKWFARWRKYCFFPRQETVYEETCMKEIAEFIVDRTNEHKAK